MESYKIQQINYDFLKQGDSRIGMQEIYSLQQRIDEYRAKFKHNDLTPFTWHFAGNKEQGWSGGTLNDKKILASTSPIVGPDMLNISADIYKYFSIKCLSNESIDTQCKLEWYDINKQLMGSKDFTVGALGEYFINIDFVDVVEWSGTIDQIKIYCPNINIYYIKVDKVDPMYIERKVDIDAFNQMVEKVERMSGTPDGTIKDLASIKAKDNNRINKNQIVKLYDEYLSAYPRAYNGCATCDVFTRDCYGGYGERACTTCDGCNEYSSCSSCDLTCYSEGRLCTCYGSDQCYQQPSWTCQNVYQSAYCTCNAPYTSEQCQCESCNQEGEQCTKCNGCYEYSACDCDGTCYKDTCVTCNDKCNEQTCRCYSAYQTTCTSCHNVSDAYCNYCNSHWKLSDGWCSASGYNNPNDGCSLCYGYQYDCWCYQVCYQNEPCTTNTPPYASYKIPHCTVCNSCNEEGTKACESKYGYVRGTRCACYENTTCTCESCDAYKACVCDTTCYTQTSCTCDGQPCYQYSSCTCNGVSTGYISPLACTCDGTCYGYNPCNLCNSCNQYSSCTMCDDSCYGDQCRDCHNTNYHNI